MGLIEALKTKTKTHTVEKTSANDMADQMKYTNKLKGTKVLVIGGSSGIGYAVAEASLESGAHVTISSSNQSRMSSAVSKLQTAYPSSASNISGHVADISNPSTIESNLQSLFQTVGTGIDHIIITAGDALSMIPLDQISGENAIQAGQVRFFAPLLIAKHAAAYLNKSASSSITFTGGVLSSRPIPGWPLVSAYAAALEGLARGLAIDLKPVRMNVVRPGVVDTNLYAASGIPENIKGGIFADAASKLPVGKVGRPEDLAEAYLYCMRDANVTGVLVDSSGGQLLV